MSGAETYNRVILTIIAGALVVLCGERLISPTTVKADENVQKVSIVGWTAQGTIPVIVMGNGSASPPLKVEVAASSIPRGSGVPVAIIYPTTNAPGLPQQPVAVFNYGPK